jgi:hypothetical protein
MIETGLVRMFFVFICVNACKKGGRTTYCEVKGKEDSLHTLNGLWCIYYLHIHIEQCGHRMTCLQKVQKCVRKRRKLRRIGREEHMGHTAKKNNQPHPSTSTQI